MIVARKVGPTLYNSAPFVPSTSEYKTHWMGVCKRMLMKMPEPEKGIYKQMRDYARSFIVRNFTPLPADYDLSDLFWLNDTNYTIEKKIQYIILSLREMVRDDKRVKTHDKLESLGDEIDGMPKNVRCINAREERFRLFWGKFSKAMEHCAMGSEKGRQLFSKYWRVADKSKELNNLFDMYINAGWHVNVNDYSSWEANMKPHVMLCCEIQFYRYMLKNIDKKLRDLVMTVITQTLVGVNRCQSKFGMVYVRGTRMSGEMSTSLGNGVTNLICTSFVLSRLGIKSRMVVEGDDAVILTQPGEYEVTSKDFAKVGLKAKFKRVKNLAEAEFCSVLAVQGVNDNCADVFDVFNRTGWSMAAERCAGPSKCLSLLRAKAYSLVYEFPRAPVVRAFGNYLLRMTKGATPRFEHGATTKYTWWDEQVLNGVDLNKPLPDGTINDRSRDLVKSRYGINVEMQKKYENYFDGLNEMIEWIPNFCFDIPMIRREHFQKFVRDVPAGYDDMLIRW